MAECIRDATPEQLNIFRRLLLTVPVRFRVLASEEARMFAHVNLRETITGAHACMSRSATQRVYEICQWRDRRAKVAGVQTATPAKLAALWAEHVQMARTSEPVTETFMGSAIRIWEHLLRHSSCRDIVLLAERTWGKASPFDSVTKMEAVLIKGGKSTDAHEWLLASMVWYVKNRFLTTGELSYRNLTGKGFGNRGLMDLWLLKRGLLDYMCVSLLDDVAFTADTKARPSGSTLQCSIPNGQ